MKNKYFRCDNEDWRVVVIPQSGFSGHSIMRRIGLPLTEPLIRGSSNWSEREMPKINAHRISRNEAEKVFKGHRVEFRRLI
jgi:hypothetical protein